MKKLLLVVLFCISSCFAFATHLRSGYITIKKNPGTLTCTITIHVYTNTGSIIRFSNGGEGQLKFGDGSPTHNPPQKENSPVPGAGPEYGFVEYSIDHVFSEAGTYIVSYFEHNLNDNIINVFNSVQTPFYIETSITIDPLLAFSSPEIVSLPIFEFPLENEFTFSTAALDTAHRYRYGLVTPLQDVGQEVLYTAIPSVKFNNYTGIMTWDTKFSNDMPQYRPGLYLFALRIFQYDAQDHLLGWVHQAFTVTLDDINSKISILTPIADPNEGIVVTENQQKSMKLIVQDSSIVDSLHWVVHLDSALVTNIGFTQYDSVSSSRKMKVGILTFNTTPQMARDYPYTISLRGSSYSNYSKESKDINVLYFTRDVQLPVVTGIAPKTESSVSVYPVPFQNNLTVKGANEGSGLTLINALGQQVLQTNVVPDHQVDTSQVPPGIYILQVINGNSVTRLKVARQ